ncbi:MAG: hypothetical protein RLZZ297_483 [Chloroflexota bacterium]|jgi:iron complex transport system ATP-binding protein
MIAPLQTKNLSVALGDVKALQSVNVTILEHSFVGVLGPNGSGKSTLLRALHRAVMTNGGTVLLDKHDIWSLHPTAVAQRISVVAQEHHTGFAYTAHDVVMMGRSPYHAGMTRTTRADETIVATSLAQVGMSALAERDFDAMSGGERQRTLIARALAQQTDILILDEPTNHLDIHYQLDILRRVRALNLTTVAALHDLNLAARWCDFIFVMHKGQIAAAGKPADVLTPSLIAEVFRVKATPYTHPELGILQLAFDVLEES